MDWKKASFGGTDSKKGGGKLEGLTKGGLPPISGVSKSSVSRIKGGIDSPTTIGDKGAKAVKGFQSKAAPKD